MRPPIEHTTVDAVIERCRAIVSSRRRHLLGIVGGPAAGKSTLSAAIVDALGSDSAAVVPMDGFHLANVQLARLGSAKRKGAPDTFDTGGFIRLLDALRADGPENEKTVYAPEFVRTIDAAVVGAIAVAPAVSLVVVEGNYLLLDHPSWRPVRDLLDEVWYLEVDPQVRTRRLIARHIEHGRSHADANRWARGTDRLNAERIENTKRSADLILILR